MEEEYSGEEEKNDPFLRAGKVNGKEEASLPELEKEIFSIQF